MAREIDWQSCMVKLSQRADFILRSGWMADVHFRVGQDADQQIFKAHKLILSMASPVFDAMLNGNMAEKTTTMCPTDQPGTSEERQAHQPILIPDIQPDAFKSMLQYIYTDEITIASVDKAVELCYAAKKYMLPHLVRECTQSIWKDLSPGDACKAYEFAKLFDVPYLTERCVQQFISHTQEVLDSHTFLDIAPRTLKVILSLDEVSILSERPLFDAALRWCDAEIQRRNYTSANSDEKQKLKLKLIPETVAPIPLPDTDEIVIPPPPPPLPDQLMAVVTAEHPPVSEYDPKDIRATLGENIFLIRFLTMTSQEFTTGPGISGLFSDEEILAILMNISMPGIKDFPATLPLHNVKRQKRRLCKKKFHCTLSFPAVIKFATAPLVTELRIFVDQDILLHGIQFHSQVLPSNQLIRTVYKECVMFQICNSENEPLAETTFSGMVKTDDKTDLYLEQGAYLIKRHTGYVLRATFVSPGSYKCFTELLGPVQSDGIHITCSYMNGFLVALHTLIFSHPE